MSMLQAFKQAHINKGADMDMCKYIARSIQRNEAKHNAKHSSNTSNQAKHSGK